MKKTHNDYPSTEVLYLTEEVLDALQFYKLCTNDNDEDFIKTKNFIIRNNLLMSIDEFKRCTISPRSYMDIFVLKHIQELFIAGLQPRLIKTPKQTVLTFSNFNLEFENDVLTKIESLVYFERQSQLEYSNVHLYYNEDKLVCTNEIYNLFDNSTAPNFYKNEEIIGTEELKIQIETTKNNIIRCIEEDPSVCSTFHKNIYFSYNAWGTLYSKTFIDADNINETHRHKIYQENNERTNPNSFYTEETFPSIVFWYGSKNNKCTFKYNKFNDILSSDSTWEYTENTKFLFSNRTKDKDKELLMAYRMDDRNNEVEIFKLGQSGFTREYYCTYSEGRLTSVHSYLPSISSKVKQCIVHFQIN